MMLLESIRQIEQMIKDADWTACAMAHERVRLHPISMEPIESEIAESGFERHGLCNPSVRKRRPACGHTNKRNHLIREITTFASDLTIQARQPLDALIEDLRRLDAQLSLLDHKKGDAELRLAQAAKANDPTQASKRKIQEIEDRHLDLLTQLKQTCNSILEILERLRLNHGKQ